MDKKVEPAQRRSDPDAERRLREVVALAGRPSAPHAARRPSLAQRLLALAPEILSSYEAGLPPGKATVRPVRATKRLPRDSEPALREDEAALLAFAPAIQPVPAPFAETPRPDTQHAARATSVAPLPRIDPAPAPASKPMEDREGVLSAWSLGKSYRGRQVVKDVSLSVRRGEAVGLLGANGAGKTTAFYMITGLVQADKGRIVLDGNDITDLPMYRRARLGIGYLPQEASIFRGLNVEDNIRAVLEVVEPNKLRREDELNALLAEFSIERLRHAPATALSGGERRRLEIARALAGRPSFILLDEPFAGIDPIAVGDIQDLVRQLTARGIGVLITDHNVRETLGLIDRAYIMHSGQLLMEGKPEAIVASEDVRRTYLGADFRL